MSEHLSRQIGLIGAMSLVMGSVIGSAIFLTTGIMAERMPSASLLIVVWLAGGVLALTGGLTCAELSTMYPQSGGWYVFLNEAYGPLWGFLFGWAGMLVMLTGSIAAVRCRVCGILQSLLSRSLDLPNRVVVPGSLGCVSISAGQVVASISIAVLGAANYIGVRTGNAVQSALTTIKLGAIAAIPILAFSIHRTTPVFGSLTPELHIRLRLSVSQ